MKVLVESQQSKQLATVAIPKNSRFRRFTRGPKHFKSNSHDLEKEQKFG